MLAVALTTVVTYLGQKVPTTLAITDGDGVPVPPERSARMMPMVALLEAHGFVAHSTVAPHGNPKTAAFARVLTHPVEATRAWVIDMQQGAIVQTYLELITEWHTGTAVQTATHTNPPIFDPLPRVHATWLPGSDVGTALASHRGACSGIEGFRIDPSGLDAIEVAQEQNREVLAHQAECGILRRRGEGYGFTWNGARRSVRRIAAAQQA